MYFKYQEDLGVTFVDRAKLENKQKRFSEFNRILDTEDIETVFQPIVSLKNGSIIGYEALSRGPAGSELTSPAALFRTADELSMVWDLELLCRTKAIERAHSIEPEKYLFINIDPNIIKDEKFRRGFTKEFLRNHNISPESIIFEITERTAIEDYAAFSETLKNYTSQGYKIAIDDMGAGYSGLKTITNTRPHYIKIDMELIRGIDRDSFKQALIKNFVNLSISTNIKIIAEGIETEEELQTLIKLGVYAGQGYFMQRPAGTFLEIPEVIKNKISKYNSLSNNVFDYSSNYHYIGAIMEEQPALDQNTICIDVKKHLDGNSLDGVCLVEDEIPKGLIMNHNLNSAMAKQYGIPLYSRKPISLIMDYSPLIVDYYTPINTVCELAMDRDHSRTYDCVIITKGFKYCGMVSIKKLLQYTSAMEKSYARELNPLTGLAGNVIINRVLTDTISYSKNCCIVYADLDNFKSYNDAYGFENGDKIIKLAADIIEKQVKSKHPFNCFVGHIGGDDFLFITECGMEDSKAICQDIIHDFDKGVLSFFNERDKNNGFIETCDRSGNTVRFDLTSISLAGFSGDPGSFNGPDHVGNHMTKLKNKVKKLSGSNYIVFED